MISILKLLRPKHIPNHKPEWDWRLRLYYWLIQTLLPLYKRSALSDTIILGNTQIIHNVRDYWYEQELHRFRMDAALSIEKRSIPFSVKRKYNLSRFFSWSDSLLILHDRGSYSIKRDKDILIDTDIEGLLKSSTEIDLFFRSEFVAKEDRSQQDNHSKQANPREPTEISIKQDISSKIGIDDTVPINRTGTQQYPKLVKYQGFEENDLF